MANSKERICAVCRSTYSYCPRCREDANKPVWMFTFCSDKCKDVYEITSNFESGEINIKDAKAQLNKYDLSNIDNYGASYKTSIGKIMSYNKTVSDNEELKSKKKKTDVE